MRNKVAPPDWEEQLDNILLQAEEVKADNHTPSTGIIQYGIKQVVHFRPTPYDLLVQCPKCKSLETVQFIGDTLTACRRFFQKDHKVYHDCGSDMPCRLLK